MNCKFIDKYIDKIYTGSLNLLEEQMLQSHMKKCGSCREFYENCMDENIVIRDSLECSDIPSRIHINIMKNIDPDKYRRRKVLRMRKYVSAAAAVLVLLTSSLFFLNRTGNFNFSLSMLNPHPSLTYLQTTDLENVLENYLTKKAGKAIKGGQLFATVDILGIKTTSIINSTIRVYAHATIGEYSYDGYQPVRTAKNTFPAVVEVQVKGNSFIPISYEVPDKNGNLTDNLKEIYMDYGSKMTKEATQDLENLNVQKAESGIIPTDSITLQENIKSFIKSYAFTPKSYEYKLRVKIPSTFRDNPGDFPIGLYWAYNNVLSKDIGLDISAYKGSEVTAHIVPLDDQYWEGPNKELRAIVIESGGKIIGSWLDRGRCGGSCTSLKRNYFNTITGKSWGQWLKDEGLVDYSTGLEAQLKKLSPEEIIKKYFSSIDKKVYATAYATISEAYKFSYIWMNMKDSELYSDNWDADSFTSNILSVKVLKIQPYSNPYDTPYNESIKESSDYNVTNRKISQYKMFTVELNMQFKQVITNDNGKNKFFICLVKETSDSPWEIDGMGTGP